MILMEPSSSTKISLNEKIIVSGVFIVSCCVGITLALNPGWIHKLSKKEILTIITISDHPKRSFYGHHPDCERFQNDRIIVRNKTWCAGCLGLSIGSLVSILFMVIYTFASFQQPRFTFLILLLFGLVLIALIFVETVSRKNQPVTHLLLNAMLVPSFFLITISVTELTGKPVFGVFTIILCVLWLDTRIILSKWRHRRTCNSCPESCKMYALSVPSVSKSL